MAEGKLQRAAWVCEIGGVGLDAGTRVAVPGFL
jgi:hypothetical protein